MSIRLRLPVRRRRLLLAQMSHASRTTCLSEAELVELFEGRLAGAPLARVNEHVTGCRTCACLVAELDVAARPSASESDLVSVREIVAEALASTLGDVALPTPVGACIAERFVIEVRAGAGGMGTVYRALDRQTGRTVAVKLLQHGGDAKIVERFAREARTLSELCHPGTVAYLAHGQTPAGAPYRAMEWLEGEDLARRLTR